MAFVAMHRIHVLQETLGDYNQDQLGQKIWYSGPAFTPTWADCLTGWATDYASSHDIVKLCSVWLMTRKELMKWWSSMAIYHIRCDWLACSAGGCDYGTMPGRASMTKNGFQWRIFDPACPLENLLPKFASSSASPSGDLPHTGNAMAILGYE